MLQGILLALADPSTIRHVALKDEVCRVCEVMLVLELLGQFACHLHNPVVIGAPFNLVDLNWEAELHGEGDAVVVDAGVKEKASEVLTLTVTVDALGLWIRQSCDIFDLNGEIVTNLDIDGADLHVVDIRQN